MRNTYFLHSGQSFTNGRIGFLGRDAQVCLAELMAFASSRGVIHPQAFPRRCYLEADRKLFSTEYRESVIVYIEVL
jgi:hypothetical protein